MAKRTKRRKRMSKAEFARAVKIGSKLDRIFKTAHRWSASKNPTIHLVGRYAELRISGLYSAYQRYGKDADAFLLQELEEALADQTVIGICDAARRRATEFAEEAGIDPPE